MEKIEIRVEQHGGSPVGRDWSVVFGVAGGTIGRGGQNKLVLPDADAAVARVHAMVRLESDGAHIANLCERRSMQVAQRELRSGEEVPLPCGTVIEIGPYVLRARALNGDAPTRHAAAPQPGRAPTAQPVPTPVTVSAAVLDLPNPWSDIPQQSGEPGLSADDNPFAMLGRVETPATVRAEAPAREVAAPPAALAPPPVHRPLAIPEDFDPFAPDAGQQRARAADPWLAGARELSLAELAPQRHDALLQGLAADPVAAQALDDARHAGLPRGLDAQQELDPLRLFEPTPLAEPATARDVALPHGHELGQLFSLPRNTAAQPPAEPPAAPAAAPAVAVPAVAAGMPAQAVDEPSAMPTPAQVPDAQALIQAFLAGAGIAPQRAAPALTPAFMQAFGEVLQVAVQGTIELLAARAEVKKELRAGMTIIATGANNPLKFLPTAEGVLLQMTGQHFPGFMAPVPAMQEAYHDLRVHQVALIAGIRAAYSEALTRFDPAQMERRSAGAGGLLARLSASSRKAALWDLYCQDYQALRRHAEDDLAAFSGKTFVQAYEAAAQAAGERR